MKFIKLICFHILLTFRGLVLGITKLFAIMFLVTGIALFGLKDFEAVALGVKILTWGFAIFFTLINWSYDSLIFYLEPENINLTLYR